MKLHLGCGQKYFEGYVNIDYPMSEHSVQQKSVADELANLTELNYPANTIDEVRLHHVFEHFSRPVTCALLSNWFHWLKPGGVVHIEVPDFEKTGKVALSRFSSASARAVALRHIFGSQEAHWAVHYEGHTPKSLSKFISLFGFEINEIKTNGWKGTYNVEVIGAKKNIELSPADFYTITENYLSDFLVDKGESELILLATWMDIYKKHVLR
ncbi:MAG: hypothetical protein IPP32_11650 [Bacteroidetes bacterium]|nr:hypothetical protein [Bacteroidota bacterium]